MQREVMLVVCCARVVVVVCALFAVRMRDRDGASFGSVEHSFDLCIHDEDSRRICEVSAGNATNNGYE